MFKLVLVTSLLFSIATFAQTDTNGIVVHKDPRIDLLVKKQIEINEVSTRAARRFVSGYRILVMSTNNRDKVQQAKTLIYKK